MKVFFNDLTLNKNYPESDSVFLDGLWSMKERIESILELKPDDERLRIVAENDDIAVISAAVTSTSNREHLNSFSSFFYTPFPDDDSDEDKARKDWFNSSDAFVRIGGASIKARMMGWAEHEDSMTIGLAASKIWCGSPTHDMTVQELNDQGELSERETIGICITHKDQLNDAYVGEQLDIMKANAARSMYRTDSIASNGLAARGRILVIGAKSTDIGNLKKFVGYVGFDVSRFEFIMYDQVPAVDCREWKNSPSIAAIICGPAPHKGGGMGDVSSFVRALHGEGFPPIYDAKKSMGVRAVTCRAFKRGILDLMKRGVIAINKA